MPGFSQRFRNTLRLAVSDYGHEWRMSGCFVLALAAVLTPMMVLFALKFGIVGSMVERLVEDPRNREVRPVASGRYSEGWFEQVGRIPQVAFVVPLTRRIAATMDMKGVGRSRIVSVEMIPTAEGEPLLAESVPIPTGLEGVVLSASAARKLGVATGDSVDGSLARRFRGKGERVHLPLKVIAVARQGAFARDAAFVSAELLIAAEDFRDGRAVSKLDWGGDAAEHEKRVFPGFRIYAASIYDVAPIRDALAAQGVDTRTRAEDIDVVQTMERSLSAIYWFIAVIGLIGFSFSLGASLWANVDRKQRELSVLRLVGFRTGDIVWFPVLQALFTGVLGWALASLIYKGVEYGINRMLAAQLEPGDTVCRLLPEHFAVALAFTVGSAVLAAALGGYRAARIEPADGLRDI